MIEVINVIILILSTYLLTISLRTKRVDRAVFRGNNQLLGFSNLDRENKILL